MIVVIERYVVVGFSENGSPTTELVADRDCKKIPPARIYDDLATARAFRTKALNIREPARYTRMDGNTYIYNKTVRNADIVDIKIAKITFTLDGSEWV